MDLKGRIVEAAEMMVREGRSPRDVTNTLIQERVGGSFRDIAPILREWKQERFNSHRDPTPPVPPAVAQAAARATQAIWEEATKLFDERLRSVEQAAAARIAEIQAEYDDLLTALNRREDECATLRESNNIQTEMIDRLQSEARELVASNATHQAKADQHLRMVLFHEERGVNLEKELTELRENYANLRVEKERLSTQLEHFSK